MAELASIIGETEDAVDFGKLAENIKDYWNRTFISPADRRTITMDGELCDTQCSYVFALEYDIVRDRKKAAAHLLRKTRELGHTQGRRKSRLQPFPPGSLYRGTGNGKGQRIQPIWYDPQRMKEEGRPSGVLL